MAQLQTDEREHTCPNCGSIEGFTARRHFHYESTGEVFDDAFLVCNDCGKKTTLEEIE